MLNGSILIEGSQDLIRELNCSFISPVEQNIKLKVCFSSTVSCLQQKEDIKRRGLFCRDFEVKSEQQKTEMEIRANRFLCLVCFFPQC